MSIVEDSIQEWFMRFVIMAIPALKSCYTESFVDKNGLVQGQQT
jgi:hypothetical protein